MITSRKELKFYLKADEIMNEQVFPQGFIKRLLLPNPIQKFMRCMRKLEYYDYKRKYSFLYIPIFLWYKASYNRLSIKNGFDIVAASLLVAALRSEIIVVFIVVLVRMEVLKISEIMYSSEQMW